MPASASHSRAYVHDGFYLRLGLGPGFASLSGEGPGGAASLAGFGPAMTLAIGGTVEDGVVVAGVWHIASGLSSPSAGPFAGTGQALAIVEQLALLVDWYPDPQGEWHVGGAMGLGLVGVMPADGAESFAGTDATASILCGYDWWIGPQWSLGVLLVATGGTRATLEGDGASAGPAYRLSAGTLGLEASVLLH